MINKKGPQKPDTKELILDSAETLFAKDGYKSTSLRAITERADVNLASVNYHFGSKKALLEEVLKRRIQPLNQVRKKKLEEVRRNARGKGIKPDVDAVLRAFIEPTLHFRESVTNAGDFIALVGRAMGEPDDTVRVAFHKLMRSVFQLFFEMVSEALPSKSKELIFWRLHFSIGAMAHTMRVCGTNMKELVHFETNISTDELIERLIVFISGGMKAK